MTEQDKAQVAIERASKRTPALFFWGCIGGLLLGVIFGNIPYGVCAGILLAIAISLISAGDRSSKKPGVRAPDADT